MKKFIVLLLIIPLAINNADAQILKKLGKVNDKITGITVDKLSRDPITTSFKDVNKRNIQPETLGANANYKNLHDQPFDPEIGFTLQPGYYEAELMSFCIKAGTYMPTKGSGRFYAEMKGPKADIFETILKAVHTDRSLERMEVQVLLWAIIAKTDFQKMKGPIKATALKILSAQQIARLSKGALDKIARDKLKGLAYKNDALKAILEAENNLRSKFYAGVKDLSEYEEVAVLAGLEPVVTGYEAGKWSKHPEGYYLRYYPSGYKMTKTQIYVPKTRGTVSFNAFGDIAVPASTGAQRLLQTNIPWGDRDWGYETINNTENNDEAIRCIDRTDSAVDAVVRTQMIMQNLQGLVAAVFRNGEIIHMQAYGYSDVYKKRELTTKSVLHWASVSKSVTAVAAHQLHQSDIDYSLGDLVTKHCSYWPASINFAGTVPNTNLGPTIDNRLANITVQHLLLNRSGIQHYGRGLDINNDGTRDTNTRIGNYLVPFVDNTNYQPENDQFNAPSSVGRFNRSVISFMPGSNYLYSSYGYNLLGATIDEASPEGYVRWVRENIANPARMTSLRVAKVAQPSGLVNPYDNPHHGHGMSEDGILKIINTTDKESVLPGGGWESNICDMAKYAIGLASGEFFDQSQDSLWHATNRTEFRDSNGNTTNFYSNGIRYFGSGNNLEVWHEGKHDNLRSYMHFYPGDTTGIVLISPTVYANLPHLADKIYKVLKPVDYSNVADHTPLDACRADMGEGNDLFNMVWRKTDKDVLIRTGIEHSAFFEEVERLRTAGYHCKDFETFFEDDVQYWDGVFQKGHPRTKMWRNANKDAFVAKSAEMKDNGYRLADLETYTNSDGKRLWAGIFKRTDDGYSVRLDRTTSEFADVRESEQAAGKNLIDVEVYSVNGRLMWNGVFSKGSPNLLNRNMTTTEFGQKRTDRIRNGFKLIDVEYYTIDGEWRVAAIWTNADGRERLKTLQTFCDVMTDHETNSEDGYELIDWERLPDGAEAD